MWNSFKEVIEFVPKNKHPIYLSQETNSSVGKHKLVSCVKKFLDNYYSPNKTNNIAISLLV